MKGLWKIYPPKGFVHDQSGLTSSVQFNRSVAQSCPTLCDPVDYCMPGLPVHHQLLELSQTHVHQVGDATQPSHPLMGSQRIRHDWATKHAYMHSYVHRSSIYNNQTWKQSKCPLTDEWIKKMWCICVYTHHTHTHTHVPMEYWKKVKVLLSHVQLFSTPWTIAYHAPLSIEFSRQEYWSGFPCPSLSNWILLHYK